MEALAGLEGVERVREGSQADVVLFLDGRFRPAPDRLTMTAVLDLGHLFRPRVYGLFEWLRQNWRVASAARRSDLVLAPSEAVRWGLQRRLGLHPQRVVVFEALPEVAFRRRSWQEVEELRAHLHLPERYFLFVGTRSRRKNLAMLARAWQRAQPQLEAQIGLVLAGKGKGGIPGALDLGYVPAEQLPALISGALAWVGPSLYEGSALGALEALCCGTPALVAAAGAPARAVEEGGLMLDPNDEKDWAEAMVALVREPRLRARLSAGALRVAGKLRAGDRCSAELMAALGARAVG